MGYGRIIPPYAQFQDFGGRNNTKGLVYVYLEPNTTTRATLYKETTREVLSNPLTINDVGQVEDFVVDTDYKYWIYVTDIDNNKVFDRHNLATMEEGGGANTNYYYGGDFITIDSSNRVNVNPTKALSCKLPITVEETKDEIILGVNNAAIVPNIEGRNGITTAKDGSKFIINGINLQNKDNEQDAELARHTTSIQSLNETTTSLQNTTSTLANKVNNLGQTLQVNVTKAGNQTSYNYTGSSAVTIPIDSANNSLITLQNDAGEAFGSFETNTSNATNITISRDKLDVYSKAEVDARASNLKAYVMETLSDASFSFTKDDPTEVYNAVQLRFGQHDIAHEGDIVSVNIVFKFIDTPNEDETVDGLSRWFYAGLITVDDEGNYYPVVSDEVYIPGVTYEKRAGGLIACPCNITLTGRVSSTGTLIIRFAQNAEARIIIPGGTPILGIRWNCDVTDIHATGSILTTTTEEV